MQLNSLNGIPINLNKYNTSNAKYTDNASNYLGFKKNIKGEDSSFNNLYIPKQNLLANQILAFCGGKSLNLSQTFRQIKELGAYPVDIEQKITEELEKGNPDNKTLIDIHR